MEMEYSYKCHISCSRVWCQGWVDSRSFLLGASLWGLGGSGSGERRARKRRIRRKRRRGATSWMPSPPWAGAALWGSSAWSAIQKIWKDPWNSRGHSWDSLRTTIACFQPDTNLIFHPGEASWLESLLTFQVVQGSNNQLQNQINLSLLLGSHQTLPLNSLQDIIWKSGLGERGRLGLANSDDKE